MLKLNMGQREISAFWLSEAKTTGAGRKSDDQKKIRT
jgi:hypothetical protein